MSVSGCGRRPAAVMPASEDDDALFMTERHLWCRPPVPTWHLRF